MKSTARTNVLWAIGLGLLFEAVTCLFRFGFDMQSTRDTSRLAAFTFGIRIHHGYIGVLLMIAAAFAPASRFRTWGLRIGAALAISDLLHHFAVLWPITGQHDFDLTYPDPR